LVKKPSGIDDRPEQLRPPVVKAEGSTKSERYLAKLADRSFLNLWAYPSPFRDQKQGGTGDGKEVCDLLVVCGAHVIIFSEKTIEWPNGEIGTAWRRWAKRAIKDSAKQTRGAERWITEHPERLFLDRECKTPFPIDLPPEGTRQIHRVVVASGSAEACREHIPDSSGSLIIRPRVVGDSHWTGEDGATSPFVVGDVDPAGSFVHVFNEASLDKVMEELDTITDFTDYLSRKTAFVRSGHLAEAQGEENLLAFYAVRTNTEGEHDFVLEVGQSPLSIKYGLYERTIEDPQYQAKKGANEISYLWDRLIEGFSKHLLGGTSITPEGRNFDLRESELGLRHMALASRFARRYLSDAVTGVLQKGKEVDRFVRSIMSPAGTENSETAFFFTMKYLDEMDQNGGYEKYREVRLRITQIYARGLLESNSHLDRVIGIGLEPPGQGRGSSGDLVYMEQNNWTDEERKSIQDDCEATGVLQELKERGFHVTEFPELESSVVGRPATPSRKSRLNGKQRRILAANARRRK